MWTGRCVNKAGFDIVLLRYAAAVVNIIVRFVVSSDIGITFCHSPLSSIVVVVLIWRSVVVIFRCVIVDGEELYSLLSLLSAGIVIVIHRGRCHVSPVGMVRLSFLRGLLSSDILII